MSKFLIALKQIEAWFLAESRVLPWRNLPTFYRVWISEIMLQQTQVSTVIPYFEKFMARFPTLEDLARASEEDVLLHWAGLGYYSRARNLRRGAQQIWAQQKFPTTLEGWLEIPGVGRYTAGAILSIAGNQPEAILDGNVERVLSRIRQVDRQKGDSLYKARLWKLARIFVQSASRNQIPPSILNQSLMELGATLCTPKNPKCKICPLIKICKASAKNEQEKYPQKKKPKEWTKVREELFCIINQNDQILVRQRKKDEWRAGLWDFLDELPLNIRTHAKCLGSIQTRHIVTRHKIERRTWVWKLESKNSLRASDSLHENLLIKWVSFQKTKETPVPVGSAFKQTLQNVQKYLKDLSN